MTWMTTNEAAEHLRVSRRTLDRWVSQGVVTRYKVPDVDASRFLKEELDELLVPSASTTEGGARPDTAL